LSEVKRLKDELYWHQNEDGLIEVTIQQHYTKTKVILAEIDWESFHEAHENGIGFVDGDDLNIEVEGWNVNTVKVLDEYEEGFQNECGKYYCGEDTIS
tara:strand:- start:3774 stop:4067 length:294 start_codon:yes stop_codon:yes gene_type:complete